MITLKLHNVTEPYGKMTMPDSWDELTPQQFAGVAYALLGIDAAAERQAYLCRILMGREKALTLPVTTLMHDIFPLLNWLNEEPKIKNQLLPSFAVGFRRYYGPERMFYNLTIKEFDFSERALHLWQKEWQETKVADNQYLWMFLACLYRPARWLYSKTKDKKGDIRIPFNENTLNYFARLLEKRVPVGNAYAAVLWYKATRKLVTAQYPSVFNGGDDEDSQPNNELPNCVNLIRKIAEKGTYGNYEHVENMHVHNILYELELSIKEIEESKRR